MLSNAERIQERLHSAGYITECIGSLLYVSGTVGDKNTAFDPQEINTVKEAVQFIKENGDRSEPVKQSDVPLRKKNKKH